MSKAYLGNKKRSNATVDAKAALKLWKNTQRARALWPKDQVFEIERGFQRDAWIRRTALFLLAMTGKDLVDKVAADREFAEAIDDWSSRIRDYEQRLEDEREVVGHAFFRVMIALAGRAAGHRTSGQ